MKEKTAYSLQINEGEISKLYQEVRSIMVSARERVRSAVNFAMVEAYWLIGKTIVDMQGGSAKSNYGDGLILELSKRMISEFGAGFGVSNLKYMRQFFLEFPIRHSLRGELGWNKYLKERARKKWLKTDELARAPFADAEERNII
ncbi:MAG: hypothetical protein IJQ34_03800 [Kiritimatiellae bacterium]|nr:hypothetical protein [Kiritimatiellia bacterium]